MKRLKWLVMILTVITGSMIPVAVLAGNPITINVTNTPQFTNGISSFTVTYVSDTEMDLSWAMDSLSTAQNIMIRAKYGSYPANIPDANTAPTDGYLVFYGDGYTTTSVIDTSMDMNQNAGTLYYTAWAQKIDGTWYTTMSSKSEESKEMVLLSFIGLFIGLLVVNIMARNNFTPIKLMAALAWAIPLIWVIGYPPSFIIAGSSLQTAMIVVLIGMFAICTVAAFRRQLSVNTTSTNKKTGEYKTEGFEGTGWHLPTFMQVGPSDEQLQEESRRTREERRAGYRARFHKAINGDEEEK